MSQKNNEYHHNKELVSGVSIQQFNSQQSSLSNMKFVTIS